MILLLVTFVVAWILSPFVLIPLVVHYKHRSNDTSKDCEYVQLKSLLRTLVDRGVLNESELDTYYRVTHTPRPPERTTEDIPSVDGVPTVERIEEEPTAPTTTQEDSNPILTNAYYVSETPNVRSTTKPPREREKVSAISVILVVGVIFVLLSGIIFTTTTWHSLSNVVRSVLIFSASVMFFGVGALADRRLHLEKTGLSFFSIGCFLLPIDIFAVGMFRLFGDWLSWDGDGRYLLGAIACILLGGASYVGTKRYKSKFYAMASLYGVSAGIGLALASCLVTIDSSAVLTILLAIYLLALLLLKGILKDGLTALEPTYSLVWERFLTSNVCIMGAVALVSSYVSVLSGVALVTMAVVFIAYANHYELNLHYLVASSVLLCLGVLQAFEFDNLLTVCAVLVVATTVVVEAPVLLDSVRAFYYKVRILPLAVGLLCLVLDNTIFERWDVLSLVSIVVMVVSTTWDYLRRNGSLMLYAQSLYAMFLVANVSNLLVVRNRIVPFAVMLFVVYLVYQCIPKLRNDFTLVCYSVVVGFFAILSNFFSGIGLESIMVLLVWVVMLAVNVFKDASVTAVVSRYVLPFSVCITLVRLFDNLDVSMPLSFFTLLVVAVALNLKDFKRLRGVVTVYAYTVGYLYYVYCLVQSNSGVLDTIVMLALTSFSAYKVVLSKRNALLRRKLIYTNVALVSLVLCVSTWDTSLVWMAFYLSVMLFVGYYALRRLRFDDDVLTIVKYYAIAILEASQWYVCLTHGHLLVSLVVILMNFIFAYNFRNNVLTLFSIVNLYYTVHSLILEELTQYSSNALELVFNVAFFLACGVVGRYLHREFVSRDKESKRLYVDYFTIFAILPIVQVFTHYVRPSGLSACIGWLLLAIYPSFYYGRVLATCSKQILLSLSSVALCFVFWVQPFVRVPSSVTVEWNCLPVVALSLVLCVVWKSYPKVREYSPFVGMAVVSTVLAIYELVRRNTLEIAILFGVLVLSVTVAKRLHTKKWKLLSVLVLCTILWIQPLVTIPKVLRTEWNCMPLIVLSIAIALIWREHPKVMEYLPFGTTLFVSIVLSISAIASQTLTDAFILLIGLISILVVSFMIKRKKWFTFSTIELVVLTLYLTRDFWLSIAWWVYLLVVGLLMISIGATNEYLKMKNESLSGNVKASTQRLFHDWKW